MALTAAAIKLLNAWISSEHYTSDSSTNVVFALTVDLWDIDPGSTTTLYFSDRRYRTAYDDTPANTLFLPRLVTPDIEIGLRSSGESLGGRVVRTVGVITLSNLDGQLDSYLDLEEYDWEGRNATLYIGADDWTWANFEVIAPEARITDLQFTDNQIRFHLGDSLFNPDDPLQSVLYKQDLETIDDSSDAPIDDSSSEDINSTLYPDSLADYLDGKPVPTYISRAWNVKPVLEDTNYSDGTSDGLYRYRLSYYRAGIGPTYLNESINVYEGGVPATKGTDWEVIERGTPGSEAFRGEFVYYSQPQGDIHCLLPTYTYLSVPSPYGTSTPLPGYSMMAILKNYAGLSDGEIDAAAFGTYDYAGHTPYGDTYANQFGFWSDDTVRLGDVLDFFAQPDGWWGPNFDGSKITCNRFKDLTTESIDLELDSDSIIDIERLKTDSPTRRVGLQILRNYGIISSLLEATSENLRAPLGREWSFMSYGQSDAGDTISTDHAASRQVTLSSSMSWFDRLYIHPGSTYPCKVYYQLLSYPSSFFRMSLARHIGELEIGDVVNVTYPRFGLDSGRKMMVTEMRLSLSNRQYAITAWAGP